MTDSIRVILFNRYLNLENQFEETNLYNKQKLWKPQQHKWNKYFSPEAPFDNRDDRDQNKNKNPKLIKKR